MKKAFFLTMMLYVFLASSALAAPLTLEGVKGNTAVTTLGNVYVAPYYGSLNGSPNFEMICDDFASEVWIGETWNVNINTYSDLTKAKFYNSAGADVYKEAAWLLYEMNLTKDYVGPQLAIWKLFDPFDTITTNTNNLNNMNFWVEKANEMNAIGWNGWDFSSMTIYTPFTDLTGKNAQEMLRGTAAPVPEPATMILLGSGLAGLAGFRKKFFRK